MRRIRIDHAHGVAYVRLDPDAMRWLLAALPRIVPCLGAGLGTAIVVASRGAALRIKDRWLELNADHVGLLLERLAAAERDGGKG